MGPLRALFCFPKLKVWGKRLSYALSFAPARFAESFLYIQAVGSPDTKCRTLERFTARTLANELVIMTYAHVPAVKMRSMELLAKHWF